MDPKACLRRWLHADTEAEREEARCEYNLWREKGGTAAKVRLIGDERWGVVRRICEGNWARFEVEFDTGRVKTHSPWEVSTIL